MKRVDFICDWCRRTVNTEDYVAGMMIGKYLCPLGAWMEVCEECYEKALKGLKNNTLSENSMEKETHEESFNVIAKLCEDGKREVAYTFFEALVQTIREEEK